MKGKINRKWRIFRKNTGHSFTIAIDHGMALGPLRGIENPRTVFQQLSGVVDAWLMTKGILEHCFEPDGHTGIILRISGAATVKGPTLENEGVTSSVREALMLGADAVALTAFIGTPYEHATLRNFSKVAEDCRRWEMPFLGVIGVGKDKEKMFDPDFIRFAARIGAEHGADIIKTYYTPKSFDKVVEACPAPVLIAGGPKMDTVEDVFNMVYDAIRCGAKGVVFGRNIWQHSNPKTVAEAIGKIIHEKSTAKEATEYYYTAIEEQS
jgi:putative autoinducer-2 (AI-2) aldolase